MELKGTVKKVFTERGVKAEGGEWVRHDVIINHEKGEYPKDACVSFSGEKFSHLKDLEGKEVKLYFDIDATENNNNRWFNRMKGYRYEKL